MAKKILYLGANKWCYTPNCKDHVALTDAKNNYKKALQSQDPDKIADATKELQKSTAGKAVMYQTLAEYHKDNLGRKPIIGLDLDGTVADFSAGLRWHMATKDGGVKINSSEWQERFPDPDDYDYYKGSTPWFESKAEFLENFFAAENRGMYRDLPIYAGASDTIAELRNYGFNIKAVTARRAIFNKDTQMFLDKHKIKVSKIVNPGFEKETVLADVYADDAPVVVNRLIEHEKRVLILNQKYNDGDRINEKDGLTKRADNWQDGVVDKIFELLDKNKK